MNSTLVKPGLFRDRREAGRLLAERLAGYANRPDVLVLALPRGGVPVAYEVARALGAPMDVFVVRKLGVPGYEELAMGAVATGGVRVLNDQLVERLGIPEQMIDAVAARELQELARRERLYRGGRPPPDVRGRTVVLVDDGLATGATMHAAIEALRQQNPARIVVAVPTASPETCEEMKTRADDVICAVTPEPFHAVGLWYHDFSQTTDEEVRDLLARRDIPDKKEAVQSPTDVSLTMCCAEQLTRRRVLPETTTRSWDGSVTHILRCLARRPTARMNSIGSAPRLPSGSSRKRTSPQ